MEAYSIQIFAFRSEKGQRKRFLPVVYKIEMKIINSQEENVLSLILRHEKY